MLGTLQSSLVEPIVRAALLEDAPWGDLTSQAFVPATALAVADLVAREPGVFSGAPVLAMAMSLTDPSIQTTIHKDDGLSFSCGERLVTVSGPARSILQAERVALNFVQRLSGIATLTSRFVAAIAGTHARIVDTRKTTPGLRLLERYAVRCGGGYNHRFCLSDAVMVKDNHLAALIESGASSVTDALRTARRSLPHTTHIEVEVDRPDQIEEVLAAGVDTILLDNFTLDQLRASVKQIAGRALIEASGAIRLETVGEIARTCVDIISVGALTHSAPSLDLGLDFRLEAPTSASAK